MLLRFLDGFAGSSSGAPMHAVDLPAPMGGGRMGGGFQIFQGLGIHQLAK